jgi:hypothetical protein
MPESSDQEIGNSKTAEGQKESKDSSAAPEKAEEESKTT